MSNCLVYYQFLCLGLPESHRSWVSKESPLNFLHKREKLIRLSPRESTLQHPPKASSSSVAGSGAEYSEPLFGSKPKQKRQKIAGIDQDELLEPSVLADPDSCFCEFKGVQIHHKVCDAESAVVKLLQEDTPYQLPSHTKQFDFPMVLLHGFGASLFTWSQVMKPLAQIIGSKVVAFDRPAFGLTSRMHTLKNSSPGTEDKKPLNPYSPIFSVLLTLYFIDSLAAEKAILVGHSAGALVALQTYFEAPERVAALILIAPAIIAPRSLQKVTKENQYVTDSHQIQEGRSNSNIHGNPVIRFFTILLKFSRHIGQAIMNLLKGMADMLNSLYKKALSAFLRSAIAIKLVRMVIDKFGIAAIRNSWYDSNQITDHVLQGYTKPLRVKGWDRALVEYTVAMLTDSVSPSEPSLTTRLNEISCPVLVVTGDSDRLIPGWNCERLSRAIPGSCVEVIKNCGHLPHEEKAQEFVKVVGEFLQSVFGGVEASAAS